MKLNNTLLYSDSAIFMVDPHLTVLACSYAGHQLLSKKDGLFISSANKLVLTSRSLAAQLKQHIDAVVSSESSLNSTNKRTLFVSRPSGKLPYLLDVGLSTASKTNTVDAGEICITIRELNVEVTIPDSLLKYYYLLTPRELEVAAGIVNGKDAFAIAQQMNVKLASVRQYIKGLMTKMGCSKQTELVRLLLILSFSVEKQV